MRDATVEEKKPVKAGPAGCSPKYLIGKTIEVSRSKP
jgi:hypothetical protein